MDLSAVKVEAYEGPIEELACDLLVGFVVQDRPVTAGLLGEVDWLLDAALSRLAVDGPFRAALGATALLTNRGKLRAERLLLVGLGPREKVDLPVAARAARVAADAAAKLRASQIAIAPPHEAVPPERAAALPEVLVPPFARFLADLPDGLPRRLVLAVRAPAPRAGG
jgi:hypothetical protein